MACRDLLVLDTRIQYMLDSLLCWKAKASAYPTVNRVCTYRVADHAWIGHWVNFTQPANSSRLHEPVATYNWLATTNTWLQVIPFGVQRC